MNTIVVVFAGEYDIACKNELRDELAPLVSEQRIVFDFSEVTYLDSTVITELLRLHQGRNGNGHERMTIVVRQPTVQKIFDILDMKRVFNVVATMDEALGKTGDAARVRYAFAGSDGTVTDPRPRAS